MAMLTGRGQRAEINVTPMIDVLLVLLIIFMVIGPASSGLETEVPQPSQGAPAQVKRDIELWTLANGMVRLDHETIQVSQLRDRLQQILKTNAPGAVFVHGESGLEFADVAAVVDEVKGAGLQQIALMGH